MNCTAMLTLSDGTVRTVATSAGKPYAHFPGTALGVFYVADPHSDEFTLWLQCGAIDSKGRAVGGAVEFSRLTFGFDSAVESADRRSTTNGKAYELTTPGSYTFPWGSQTVRRFVRGGGRFASRYRVIDSGPLASRWPELPTSHGYWQRRAQRLRGAVIAGKSDTSLNIYRDARPPFFSEGPQRGDEPGGYNVYFHAGYHASDNAAWCHRQMMDLVIDRMRTACFDAATGAQITRDDWIKRRGSVPDYRTGTPPLGDGKQNDHNEYDGEHIERAYLDAIGAYAQYRDPIAQRFLIQLAHHVLSARHANSLPSRISSAAANPGQATANMGRESGWAWFLMSVARWAGDKTSSVYGCGEMFKALYEMSAMSNGFAARATAARSSGGITSPWDNKLWSAAYDHLQSFEVWIMHNAVAAWEIGKGYEIPGRLARITGIGIPKSIKIMLKATDQLVRNEALGLHQYAYSKWSWGPPHYVVCADANGAPHRQVHMGGALVPDGTDPTWIGDPAHVLHGVALAYRMSGEPVYRDILRMVDTRTDTLEQKRKHMLKAFIQDESESDYSYAQSEQARAWAVEALSVIG